MDGLRRDRRHGRASVDEKEKDEIIRLLIDYKWGYERMKTSLSWQSSAFPRAMRRDAV